jgi:hypothetical protein
MNSQSELMENTKINVKEISDLRKAKLTLSQKVAENDKLILRIRAEWAEDVDYWKGQIEDTVNREKLILATEVCQLRDLLLARQDEFDKL